MANGDVVVVNGGKAGWFLTGAAIVACAIGAFLYFDGYFAKKDTVDLRIELPKVEIDAK